MASFKKLSYSFFFTHLLDLGFTNISLGKKNFFHKNYWILLHHRVTYQNFLSILLYFGQFNSLLLLFRLLGYFNCSIFFLTDFFTRQHLSRFNQKQLFAGLGDFNNWLGLANKHLFSYFSLLQARSFFPLVSGRETADVVDFNRFSFLETRFRSTYSSLHYCINVPKKAELLVLLTAFDVSVNERACFRIPVVSFSDIFSKCYTIDYFLPGFSIDGRFLYFLFMSFFRNSVLFSSPIQ